jgi:hypothetical protein
MIPVLARIIAACILLVCAVHIVSCWTNDSDPF